MTFYHREDAGRQLAAVLRHHARAPIVVGLARGGVPVALEIARELAAPLEVLCARRLTDRSGAVFGAIVEGGAQWIDDYKLRTLQLTAGEVAAIIEHERSELAHMIDRVRERPMTQLAGREVILVDDGVVTGATVRVAARALRAAGATSVELATPVAAAEALDELRGDVDRVTCLTSERDLVAVGARYVTFPAVSDAEIARALGGKHQLASLARDS